MMIQRRAKAAGLRTRISARSFRATGITTYLQNGGKLEIAQHMAGHESARTTRLYDRRSDEVELDEVERIAYWKKPVGERSRWDERSTLTFTLVWCTATIADSRPLVLSAQDFIELADAAHGARGLYGLYDPSMIQLFHPHPRLTPPNLLRMENAEGIVAPDGWTLLR
jgi:hypothetical protein